MGYGARDGLHSPYEGYPAFGAVHDVVPTPQLRAFIANFSTIADGVLDAPREVQREQEAVTLSEVGESIEDILAEFPELDDDAFNQTLAAEESVVPMPKGYDPRRFYSVYNPENFGVTVVEMNVSGKQARKVRTLWEGHDFGAVKQEAQTEIGRTLPQTPLKITFDRVVPVGGRLPNVAEEDLRDKLALLPQPTSSLEQQFVISEEANLIIKAIKSRLHQFVYPWDVMPHITFAAIHRTTPFESIRSIIAKSNEALAEKPITLTLDPLEFRSQATRKKKL